MADDLTPSDIRAHKFGVSRRGYDRSEVAEFLGTVADRVKSLEAEIASITQRFDQLGITELPDLKREVDDLGDEIQTVLHAAMSAAEGVRNRADADAAEMREEARKVSRALRGDAWETGTDLLHQADDVARRTITESREDALFIRAEAEQDAKRLSTDARRQADEMLRSSRDDAERIVVLAKAESEAILEAARQSAEKAQERARALENRRSELLGELEAAETAIRDIEATQVDPDLGIRVISPGSDDQTRWPEDDGAVRILPAAELTVPPRERQTIDADAMAAEVAEMRSAVTMPQPAETVEVDIREEPEPVDEPVAVIEPVMEPVTEPAAAPATDEEVAESSEPVSHGGDDAAAALVADDLEPVSTTLDESAEAELTDEAPQEDKVTVVSDAPGIEALFATLRQSPDEPDAPHAEPEPEPVAVAVAVAEPEPAPPVLEVVPPVEVAEGFDRRDRMLLPIENRGLRGLKRRIVELQNRVLEELRTSDGQWRLGRELVVQTMGDELDAVLQDSFLAGHAAAAESIGAKEPQATGGPRQGAAETFTVDLHRDVQSVIERGADGGSRRLSADVGRVFRSWRTDDAERHARSAARRAFNDGLLAGYARLGVESVEISAPRRPCGQCGADTGITWRPGDDLPAGVIIPPAGQSCEAMIVPAGSDGFDSPPS